MHSPVQSCPLSQLFSNCRSQLGFPGGTSGKESTCPCTRQEMEVQSLGREDPLEEGTVNHSSLLAWRIPMGRGAWQATVRGVTQSDTTEVTFSMHACHTNRGDSQAEPWFLVPDSLLLLPSTLIRSDIQVADWW